MQRKPPTHVVVVGSTLVWLLFVTAFFSPATSDQHQPQSQSQPQSQPSQPSQPEPLSSGSSSTMEELDEEVVWATWTIPDIEREWLQCWQYTQQQTPEQSPEGEAETETEAKGSSLHTYTPETWNLMKLILMEAGAMQELVSPGADLDFGPDGFAVPFETKFHAGKDRRANHAVHDVAEGTMIWKSTHTGTFRDGATYRTFVRRLPPRIACDVISATYMRRDRDGGVVACVDLDAGAFTNGADTEEELNVAVRADLHTETGCDVELYATREIRSGEELAIDFSSMALGDEGWIELGLHSDEEDEYMDEYDEEEGELPHVDEETETEF